MTQDGFPGINIVFSCYGNYPWFRYEVIMIWLLVFAMRHVMYVTGSILAAYTYFALSHNMCCRCTVDAHAFAKTSCRLLQESDHMSRYKITKCS